MLFFIWYGVCRDIMVGLLLMIDYLCFFSFFSWQLKCTIVICLFVVCLGPATKLDSSYLSLGTMLDPRSLGLTTIPDLRALGLTTIFGVRSGRGLTVTFSVRLRLRGLTWPPDPSAGLAWPPDLSSWVWLDH
jgi:hypothetical protein